jgi:predicted Fe-Mo cluster-binding NifX family protein
VNLPVFGIVENMSGLLCPRCGETVDVFGQGGGAKMAEEMRVAFLGHLPIDPAIAQASDAGQPFAQRDADTVTARQFERIVEPILTLDNSPSETPVAKPPVKEPGDEKMRIAIPLAQGKLSMHFGHCEEFALIDIDPQQKVIIGKELVAAPDHQPGLLPRWLRERGVTNVIAGGMGGRALSLFEQAGVNVHIGAPADTPKRLVELYMEGNLPAGTNVCDH